MTTTKNWLFASISVFTLLQSCAIQANGDVCADEKKLKTAHDKSCKGQLETRSVSRRQLRFLGFVPDNFYIHIEEEREIEQADWDKFVLRSFYIATRTNNTVQKPKCAEVKVPQRCCKCGCKPGDYIRACDVMPPGMP